MPLLFFLLLGTYHSPGYWWSAGRCRCKRQALILVSWMTLPYTAFSLALCSALLNDSETYWKRARVAAYCPTDCGSPTREGDVIPCSSAWCHVLPCGEVSAELCRAVNPTNGGVITSLWRYHTGLQLWVDFRARPLPSLLQAFTTLLLHGNVTSVMLYGSGSHECCDAIVEVLRRYFTLHRSITCGTLSLHSFPFRMDDLLKASMPCLHHLSLTACVVSSRTLSDFVRLHPSLCVLHLRCFDREQVCWTELWSAVAGNPTVQRLTLSHCTLNAEDVHRLFHLADFRARSSMKVSFLSAGPMDEMLPVIQVADGSTAPLLRCLSAYTFYCTSEECSTKKLHESLLALIPHCPSLRQLCWWGGASVDDAGLRRVLRCIEETSREWEKVVIGGASMPVSTVRRLLHVPLLSHAVLGFTDCPLAPFFCKLSLNYCLSHVSRLDLSGCGLTDDCFGHLATAIDRSGEQPGLRFLHLDHNTTRDTGKGLLRLIRSLRAARLPNLEELTLLRLSLTQIAIALLLQDVTPTLHSLTVSQRLSAATVSGLVKRQKGTNAFHGLTVFYEAEDGEDAIPDLPPPDASYLREQLSIQLFLLDPRSKRCDELTWRGRLGW